MAPNCTFSPWLPLAEKHWTEHTSQTRCRSQKLVQDAQCVALVRTQISERGVLC